MTLEEFINYLEEGRKTREISWLSTNKLSYDWNQLNWHWEKTKKHILKGFKDCALGWFDNKTKQTEYLTVRIIDNV